MLHRLFRLLGYVDLPLFQAVEQIVGRQVDQLNLVGSAQKRIRKGFPDDDAGDLPNNIIQALKVLDVDGGVDRDACVEQILDVLPAFFMLRFRRIRMRQFVNDNERRVSRQCRIDVKFQDIPAAMGMYPARQDFQAVEEGFRLFPTVGFHNPNDDVDAFLPPHLSGSEHCIGFTHARGGAEEYLQLALALTLLLGDSFVKKFVGIGSFCFHGYDILEK